MLFHFDLCRWGINTSQCQWCAVDGDIRDTYRHTRTGGRQASHHFPWILSLSLPCCCLIPRDELSSAQPLGTAG